MSRLTRVTICLLLCLILVMATFPATSTQAQAPAQGDLSQVDATITQLMATYDVPGVSIALVRDGKVIYVKGYGVRNTITRQPVTEDTLFAIGSVTKSFTALDVSQLVDAGKLDLDTPLIKYLPDFKLSDAEATQKLTLRHLMSHTSGLPRSEDWYFNKTTSRKQVIDDMAKINLTAPVGKVWQYNNQNFVLAGYLVETVSGQSWEDYTRTHVFEPLGMKTANFDVTAVKASPDYADPHALDVLKGMQPIPFFGALGAVGPAGSINASARDMGQYLQFQLSSGTVGGKTIVSGKMLNLMHTQQISMEPPSAAQAQGTAQATAAATQAATAAAPPSAEPLFRNIGYDLGWFSEDYRGYHLVVHDGAIDGFSTYATLVPAEGVGVVVLTNANAAGLFLEVARLRLVEWLLGLKPDRDLVETMNKASGFDPATLKTRLEAARSYKADPAAVQALIGDYTGPVGKITLSLRDGKLYLYVESQKFETELIPFEAGGFLANAPQIAASAFTFKTDAQGTISLYQEVYGRTVEIGKRLGKGVTTVEYKDPKGRFTFTVPQGLTAVESSGLAVIKTSNPDGTFVMGAADATGGDLKTEVKKWLQAFDPAFDNEPVNVRDVPINGLTWTQFLYQLPSDQILAVVALKQGNTVYFATLQGKAAAIQALTANFNAILLSFKITK